MSSPVLYSTNAFLKLSIQRKFFGDEHYVWCSEAFDTTTLPAYDPARLPPSSDPAAIFRELRRDVVGQDRHSAKITAQRASFQRLATAFARSGKIDERVKKEIFYMAKWAGFADWRPLLYVIPRAVVASRLQLVDIAKRASFGNEYIIKDLRPHEFDPIEL